MAADHTADPTTSRAMTVWVVEDDAAVAHLIEAFLLQARHRVTRFPDAEQAEMAAECPGLPPELLLTDLQLPGMSGITLAHHLTSKWPALRVLTMSATDRVEVLARLAGLPNHYGHLKKPFRMEALLAAVATATGPVS